MNRHVEWWTNFLVVSYAAVLCSYCLPKEPLSLAESLMQFVEQVHSAEGFSPAWPAARFLALPLYLSGTIASLLIFYFSGTITRRLLYWSSGEKAADRRHWSERDLAVLACYLVGCWFLLNALINSCAMVSVLFQWPEASSMTPSTLTAFLAAEWIVQAVFIRYATRPILLLIWKFYLAPRRDVLQSPAD